MNAKKRKAALGVARPSKTDWVDNEHAETTALLYRAPELIDVDALVAELKAILNRDPSVRGDRLRRLVIIQDQLAVEFGRRRGWSLSRSPFLLAPLWRGWHETIDNRYYYRANRQPIGIVAHLYEFDCEAIDAACARFGLRWETSDDFPSWWIPGFTRLVVYTRWESMRRES